MDLNSIIAVQSAPVPADKWPSNVEELLAEPFDPELIKFKPQQTRSVGNGNREGQAAAYADPRAYTDRLNHVFGIGGWFQTINAVSTVAFPFKTKVWNKVNGQNVSEETFQDRIKVIVDVTVGIYGLGVHSDIGEQWGADENAATSAYSQAFKRACYAFGLGRYLYNLPKQWCLLDKKGFFAEVPTLPDWAFPAPRCFDCGGKIIDVEWDNKGKKVVVTMDNLIDKSLKAFNRMLCFTCGVKAKRAQTAAAAGPKAAPAIDVAPEEQQEAA